MLKTTILKLAINTKLIVFSYRNAVANFSTESTLLSTLKMFTQHNAAFNVKNVQRLSSRNRVYTCT